MLEAALPKVSSGSYKLLAQIVFGGSDGQSLYEMYTPNNIISIPIQVVEDQLTPPVAPRIPGPLPGQPEPPAGATTGGGEVNILRSFDPNEKVGSNGLGIQHLSAFSQRLIYTIYFENQASATTPAQEIFVTDKLDPSLDWNSLRFEEISIGGHSLALSSVTTPYADQFELMDYRPTVTRTWQLDFSAQVNLVNGQASWIFRSLDPLTGDLPADPQAGLLPPNDLSGRGEGHITYSILPEAGVVSGTLVTNTASIVFDVNPPILTNPITNTLALLSDLAMGMQAGPANPLVGETLIYSITLMNLQWDPSGPITVSLTLPFGASLISLSPSLGYCTTDFFPVCRLDQLVPSGQYSLRVALSTIFPGPALMTACASAPTTTDPNRQNNCTQAAPLISGHLVFLPIILQKK